MLKGFRDFMMRGNVLDLTVAVIIGAAFTKVVNSLVEDIIMPPIGLVLGKVDFSNLFVVLREGAKTPGPYATLADARAAGAATFNYGLFLNAIVDFLIVAFVIFVLIRQVNRLKGPAPVEESRSSWVNCLSLVVSRRLEFNAAPPMAAGAAPAKET